MLPRGLLKEYSQILSFILRGLDVIAVIGAGLIAYFYKFGNLALPESYVYALLISGVFTMLVFSSLHSYASIRAKGLWQYIRNLIQAISTVLLLLAGLAFITKTGDHYSRSWFGWWAVFSFSLIILFRSSLLIVLRIMRASGWNERRVIIIGAGELGESLAQKMQQALWTGFRIIAILDDDAAHKPRQIAGIPVIQVPADISSYVTKMPEALDEIWLALPLGAENRVKELLHELRHHTLSIRFVLDIFGMGLLNHSIMDLAGFPTLNLNSSPMVGMNRLVKAIEDRILAALILVLISPLLCLIALGVKLTSRGPVLFKQLRHGWDGRIIEIYKFRTMVEHAEEDGKVTQAKSDDHRVTLFGRFLRQTSLDELPQFINVLQGRMSIVGPRPHAVSHNEFYKESIKAYMQRHKVKPGITGWAQVNGWRGETQTLDKMQKRVEYDLFYIENWSLMFDLKIILLTFFQGFIHKNAY
ncbi:MAG: undecaprenyl-phosphate glucose phosphotransferase [Gammaproteobacteria bacterium]